MTAHEQHQQRAADNAEHRYRFLERLGMLCGVDEPTPAQEATAFACANLWREEMIERRRPARGGKHGDLFAGMREAVG